MRKAVVMIEGRRDDYSAENCANNSMTVGELISALECYDYNLPVILNNDNGYTFGEIHESTIEEQDIEPEEYEIEEYDEDEEE